MLSHLCKLKGVWFAICFLLILTSPVKAFDVKHQLDLQSGSMVGMAHLSYGVVFSDNHTVALGFGYVPDLDNHDEMTITSLRYRFEGDTRIPLNVFGKVFEVSPYNFGIVTISGHDDEIYSDTPEFIPDGYYYPTSRRFLFNYQTVIEIDHKTEAYLDWSVLDVGLINYARNFDFYRDNYKFLGLEGIVSYGVGVRTYF